MSIKSASKRLGICEQAVRTLMRKGRLPVGICIKNDERWQFVIYTAWLERYLQGDPVEIPDGMSDKE